MRISSSEIKIPKIDNPNSRYIEENLQKMGLKVIRWAIVGMDEKDLTVSVSYSEY